MTPVSESVSPPSRRAFPRTGRRRIAAIAAAAAGLVATAWAHGTTHAADARAVAPAPSQLLPVPAGAGIRRDGGHWVLEARAAPRADLAARLAQLSQSAVHERPAVLERLPPLTRHWRGTSLAEAWQQVLGPDVSHALQCSASRCRVWIAGVATVAADGRRAPLAPGARAALPPTRSGAAGPAAQPEPSPALPGMPQPDPPGLFPAD